MENRKTVNLTVKEAAEYVHCSEMTIYRLIHRKDFPAVRIGRKILIPIEALDKWISEGGSRG